MLPFLFLLPTPFPLYNENAESRSRMLVIYMQHLPQHHSPHGSRCNEMERHENSFCEILSWYVKANINLL